MPCIRRLGQDGHEKPERPRADPESHRHAEAARADRGRCAPRWPRGLPDTPARLVSMGHLALKRAIRHAEANDLVSRNVAALADTPKGQDGRPLKSLTLKQAVAIITGARTLPVMELRLGLKDFHPPGRADARLNRVEPAGRDPHRGGPGATVGARGPGWRPGHPPALPPHLAVWRSMRGRGETEAERSGRTLALPSMAVDVLRDWADSQASERLATGGRLAGHRAGFHHPPRAALDAGTSGRCSNGFAPRPESGTQTGLASV